MKSIKRKSLLYKSGVEYADYSINHAEGCSHGCRFPCYAMMMKKRCGVIKDYDDWLQPKIVSNALELLDSEIPTLKDKIDSVHLCFTTDPFMYKQPEITDLTLRIIDRLNQDDIPCTVLTKGIYPKELADIAKYGRNSEYAITLISLDENFRNQFEPGSAPYQERINSLKYLHGKGLKTWISMEPYTTPNLAKQDLLKLLESVSFVDKIIFGKWNYNTKASNFREKIDFYEQCAKQVIDFCSDHDIDYHIKYGTRKEDDRRTQGVLNSKNVNKGTASLIPV